MGVLRTLVSVCGQGGGLRGSQLVEQVVKQMMCNNVEVCLEGRQVLVEILKLTRSGFLDLDIFTLAYIFETLIEEFNAEIEIFIIDSLEVKNCEQLCDNSSSSLLISSTILLKIVSISKSLFTMAVRIFSSFLLANNWNIDLLHLYQQFIGSVINVAANPFLLYPYTSQSLAILLITYRDITNVDIGDRVVESVKNNFDLNSWDVKIVLLQFPEFVAKLI